jgi:hypothetical protein
MCKNKKKFVFPVLAKVRLDNYSNEDFGATALITPVNLSFHYIVPNSRGGMQEMSELIYKDIFKRHLRMEYSKLIGLDLTLIIP